jgi:hypothetical protein
MTYAALLTTALLVTGCFSATEEMWIESDGSGRLEVKNDLSNFYPFLMMGLMSEETEEEMLPEETIKQDKEAKMAPAEEEEGDPFDDVLKRLLDREEVDTIFDFGVLMQQSMAEQGMPFDMESDEFWELAMQGMRSDDSMTEEQKLSLMTTMKAIMNMKLRLQINRAEQNMAMTTIQEFEEFAELQSLGEGIMALAPLMNEGEDSADIPFAGEDAAMMKQLFGGLTQYELLDRNTLRITRQAMDFSDLDEDAEQGLAMLRMFMGEEDYRLIVHLPGRVRRISHPAAEKIDRNTVELAIPMETLFDPEQTLDFTIQFRNR